MSTNGDMQGNQRFDFIDVHRGIAVVLMIWMHSADAWLRPELKSGYAWDAPWNLVRSLGGLAAPSFLLLAGVSCGIALCRAAGSGRSEEVARSQCARGLQLVVLGYVLRLQMWLIDAGAVRQWLGVVAGLALACGYAWAYSAIARIAERKPALGLCTRAAAALVVGFMLAGQLAEPRVTSLVRVDVLQAIGASLAIVSSLQQPLLRRAWLGLLLAALVALATHWLRPLLPGPLPTALAAYLGQWPPPPGRSYAALFPLFPWLAYTLVGLYLGQVLAKASARGAVLRTAVALALAGIPLAIVGCEPLPIAKALVAAWPPLLQVVRVLYRVGASLLLLGLALALSRPRIPFAASLRTLGIASLFVYWVHLELTFGIVMKPVVRTLDFPLWALGFALLVVLMSVLARLWVGLRARLARPLRETFPAARAAPDGSRSSA